MGPAPARPCHRSCYWGKQQCKPDGTWGTCSETAARPPYCFNLFDPIYDEDCCLAEGQCCQDYDGPDRTKSKGNCNQIACAINMAP